MSGRNAAARRLPRGVPHLLQLLATRSASLLNQAEFSRTGRLTQTTLKRFLSLLETLFLAVRIPAWARNPGKRLVRFPKLFLPVWGYLLRTLGDGLNEKETGDRPEGHDGIVAATPSLFEFYHGSIERSIMPSLSARQACRQPYPATWLLS